MFMLTGLSLPIADPLTVAPVKFTVPKSASGRMPPLLVQQGASAMTSAEERAAPEAVAVTVWLQPWVVSASVSVKLSPLFQVTEPVKWSPGLTVLLKFTGYAGYISYQE